MLWAEAVLEGGCGLERAACHHCWQAEKGWKGLVAGTSRGIDPGLTRPKLPSSVPWQGSRDGQWSSYPCVSTFLSPKNLNCSILKWKSSEVRKSHVLKRLNLFFTAGLLITP